MSSQIRTKIRNDNTKEFLLYCGHTIWFNTPYPRSGSLVLCRKCDKYEAVTGSTPISDTKEIPVSCGHILYLRKPYPLPDCYVYCEHCDTIVTVSRP